MKLEKVFKLFQKLYSNITFELKSCTKERLEFTADIYSEKNFDDGIFAKFIAYDGGTVHVFFTLDKLDGSYDELYLINEFNANTSFLKAYIEEKSNGVTYLELHGTTINAASEKDVVDAMDFFLGNLISESVLKYLHPLTNITRE